ncbi:amino acid ABC transporter ATP-binding protein [Roseibacterium sp. SDUM158016]|nr:amino acid ABC transporter ATP-binding protein [Roseibacterium sp. SDUM158016]
MAARGITKSYDRIEVLHGIDLWAGRGDVVTLIGASGSGKSTFIRCLNFLEQPDAGEVIAGGEVFPATAGRSRRRADRMRIDRLRTRVGMVFQSFNLWPHRTALANVAEGPMLVLGLSRTEATDRARHYLGKVGLADRTDHYPSQLSGGQQQRVAIARALAMDPEAILFDEPTSALDPELVGEVLSVIADLASEGRTMVIVTHEMSFARDVSTQTLFLARGTIIERGPPAIMDSPTTPELQNFLSRFSR